jgi:lipopolysaccharide exporter
MTFDKTEQADTSINVAPRRKTSFSGDVIKLTSGTVFAQALLLLASPFLTRLYSPESFGIFALFTSITAIITVISCMRYELAIMLPKSDKEAANLLGVSLIFVTLVALLTIPVVWWGRKALLQWLKAPALSPYLWLIPLAVFVGGVFLAFKYWNFRTKHFGRISIAKVASSATTVSAQLSVGYTGYATSGTLIGASIAGQAIATTVLGARIWRNDSKLLVKSIRFRDMIKEIKRHRKFPMYSTWSAFLNTVSSQLPVMLLSVYFPSAIVGFYAFGHRILKTPMVLIGDSISKVFFQRASEARIQSKLAPLVENTFRKLVMLGMFPILMLIFIGKDLFSVVFGANWAEAGVYVQILALFIFFQFISSPIGLLYIVLEKQEFGLKLNIVIFITRLIALWFGGYMGSVKLALVLFSSTGVIIYGYYSYYVLRLAGLSLPKMLNIIIKELIFFLPFGLIQAIVTFVSPYLWLRLLVALMLLMIYFVLINKKIGSIKRVIGFLRRGRHPLIR